MAQDRSGSRRESGPERICRSSADVWRGVGSRVVVPASSSLAKRKGVVLFWRESSFGLRSDGAVDAARQSADRARMCASCIVGGGDVHVVNLQQKVQSDCRCL